MQPKTEVINGKILVVDLFNIGDDAKNIASARQIWKQALAPKSSRVWDFVQLTHATTRRICEVARQTDTSADKQI